MKAGTIKRKILSWMLVVAILPLFLLTFFYLYSYDTQFKKQIFADLNHIADYKTIQINDYLKDRISEAQRIAQLPCTKKALKKWVPKFKPSQENRPEDEFLRYQCRENTAHLLDSGYDDILLISRETEIVWVLVNADQYYTRLTQQAYAASDLAQSVKHALRLHEPYVSNFSYYPPNKALTAFIAVPVLEKKHVLGIIVFQIGTKKLQAIVQDATGLGGTGETHIATLHNQQPLFMTHQDKDFAAMQLSKPPEFYFGLPMLQAFKGISGSYITLDRKGFEVLAVSRYLPELQAGLVVKIQSAEALRELNVFWIVSLVVIFFILSGVIFSAFFLADRLPGLLVL